MEQKRGKKTRRNRIKCMRNSGRNEEKNEKGEKERAELKGRNSWNGERRLGKKGGRVRKKLKE